MNDEDILLLEVRLRVLLLRLKEEFETEEAPLAGAVATVD